MIIDYENRIVSLNARVRDLEAEVQVKEQIIAKGNDDIKKSRS